MAAAVVETVLIGRCLNPDCKRPFRIAVPLTFVATGRVWHANLVAAGVAPPLCDCGEWGRGAVDWRPLTVVDNPDVPCNGRCADARSSKCVCSCNGENHGSAHAVTLRGV